MSYGWSDRKTKVEVHHRIGGDNPSRVVKIGKYEVTIPDDLEADVEYCVPHYRHAADDPRTTFPNLVVEDGELRFPVEDLVPLILSRLDPAELAQSLWANNDEVREAFIEAATTRWSQMGIGDPDRRKLIAGMQEAVHSAALDRVVDILGTLEQRFGSKWFFWNQISRARDIIKNVYPLAEDDVRIADPDHDPQFKCVGENWNEAREYWRREIAALFPAPEDEAAIAKAGVA